MSASGSLAGEAAAPSGETLAAVAAAAAEAAVASSPSSARSMMMLASPTSNSIPASPNSPTCIRWTACARRSRTVGGTKYSAFCDGSASGKVVGTNCGIALMLPYSASHGNTGKLLLRNHSAL